MKTRFLMLLLSASMLTGNSWAQTDTTNERPQGAEELNELFNRLDESEQSYRYAQLALAAGDIRSAISSLERVLQLNPNLANIKYELGLLYLEVGQSELAQLYLEQSLEDPSIPEVERQRAEQALVRAKGDRRRVRFSGFATGGLRWDENPSAATASIEFVDQLGDVFEITRDSGGLSGDDSSDGAYEVSAGAQLGIVLAPQMGHELVIDARADTTTYMSADNLDSVILQARIGPRINFGNASRPTGSLRPYIAATSIDFADELLYTSWAAGAEFSFSPTRRSFVTVRGEHEDRAYNFQAAATNAEARDGTLTSASIDAAWRLDANTTLRLGAGGSQYEADGLCQSIALSVPAQDCESYDAWRARAAIERQLKISASRSVRLSASGGYRSASYSEGDPFINPAKARDDDVYNLAVSARTPVTSKASLYVSLGYSDNSSNIPNFDYENTVARAGLTVNF